MERIKLNAEEKAIVIERCLAKLISTKEAAYQLGVSARHFCRIKKTYQLLGTAAFQHKNKNKSPWNKTSPQLVTELETLLKNELRDLKILQAYRVLTEKYNYTLSYSSLVRIRRKSLSKRSVSSNFVLSGKSSEV
jgi:transposase